MKGPTSFPPIPPATIRRWVTSQVWQKQEGSELKQVLYMQSVTAATPEEAYEAATALDELELVKQGRYGYQRSMQNAAWFDVPNIT